MLSTSQIKKRLSFMLLNDSVTASVDPVFHKNQWMQKIVVEIYPSRRILIFLSCIYSLFQLLSISNRQPFASTKSEFWFETIICFHDLGYHGINWINYPTYLLESVPWQRAHRHWESSSTFPSDRNNKLKINSHLKWLIGPLTPNLVKD